MIRLAGCCLFMKLTFKTGAEHISSQRRNQKRADGTAVFTSLDRIHVVVEAFMFMCGKMYIF